MPDHQRQHQNNAGPQRITHNSSFTIHNPQFTIVPKVVIEDAGHVPFIEKLEEFNEVLHAHLRGVTGMEKGEPCSECPARSLPIARPAVVQLAGDGETWMLLDEGTPVHIAALFRDPGITDERPVEVVLDLHRGPDGHLKAGRHCWVDKFLEALRGLPVGITVALDNGVRCPTPTNEGFEVYKERAKHCHGQSVQWFSALEHPNGGAPGIAICDKDLARSLAELGLLRNRNGEVWRKPARFVDAVGDKVTYLGVNAIILAHPVIFRRRYASVYRQAFAAKGIISSLTQLARLGD